MNNIPALTLIETIFTLAINNPIESLVIFFIVFIVVVYNHAMKNSTHITH